MILLEYGITLISVEVLWIDEAAFSKTMKIQMSEITEIKFSVFSEKGHSK